MAAGISLAVKERYGAARLLTVEPAGFDGPVALAPGFEYSSYAFEFTASRNVQHYIWKVILPLILIVAMSWTVFWIAATEVGPQLGVATTSMLTLIAYRFAIDRLTAAFRKESLNATARE